MAGEEAPAAAAGAKKDEMEKPVGEGGGEGKEEEEEEHQSIGKNLVNPDIIYDRWAEFSAISWPWSFDHIPTHTNVTRYMLAHATYTHCFSLPDPALSITPSHPVCSSLLLSSLLSHAAQSCLFHAFLHIDGAPQTHRLPRFPCKICKE